MEVECVPYSEDEMAAYNIHIEAKLRGMTAKPVINMDDTRFKQRIDANKQEFTLPSIYMESKLPLPIEKTRKQTSVIVGRKALGTELKLPCMIARKTCESNDSNAVSLVRSSWNIARQVSSMPRFLAFGRTKS
jgi:hypothetical protein